MIVCINYFIDPAYLFKGKKYEDGIADILSKNKNVANITNYDERLVQKYYIQRLYNKKDIVVLGSSRAMQIKAENFPGQSFFNSSVTGASIEDYMAIYYLYRKSGLLPSKIIIAVDPWILNKNNGQTRFSSLEKEYIAMMKLLVSKRKNPISKGLISDRVLQLFSLTYFQASIKEIWDKTLGSESSSKGDYFDTDKEEDVFPIKNKDGSYSYDSKTRGMTLSEVRKAAKNYANEKEVFSLYLFKEIDPELREMLEKLIKLMISDKVEVVLFVPPYHPETFTILKKRPDTAIILETQKSFKAIANKYGIKFLGSNNPSEYGLLESDFYDGMHPKNKAISKILTFEKR